ncbi:hypothetical protein ACTFIT_004727 [Dictyostelium discoideum]
MNKIVIIKNQTIIIKIINYLTSFWVSGGKFGDSSSNEMFSLVMNGIVRDLSMVSKEWYNTIIPIGLKLPQYYLLNESELLNKGIKRMINSKSIFIKLGSVTNANHKSRLLNEFSDSISSITLKPNFNATDISNSNQFNIKPWCFKNLQSLQLNLGDYPNWKIYLNHLFPINQFNSQINATNDQLELLNKLHNDSNCVNLTSINEITNNNNNNNYYNFDWTNQLKTLILDFTTTTTNTTNATTDFDLTIFDNFIKLGGFYKLNTLKLKSNLKRVDGLCSELTKKVETFQLYGIRIDSEQISKLLASTSNNLKFFETSQCLPLIGSKSICETLKSIFSNSNNSCKLESYHQTSYSNEDLNDLISLLSSSNNENFKSLKINSQIELSKNSNSNNNNNSGSGSSIGYNQSSIQYLSLILPDTSFCKFIFSKVSFKLTTLNLKFIRFYSSNLNDKLNNDTEMIDIIIEILKNQNQSLKILKIQNTISDLDKLKQNPINCSISKLLSFICDKQQQQQQQQQQQNEIEIEENQLEEINLRNFWISKETIITTLSSFNNNSKSKVKSFYISGLSDFKPTDISHTLLSNDTICKLISFGISLMSIKDRDDNSKTTTATTTTSLKNKFSSAFRNTFSNINEINDCDKNYLKLLIEILKSNKIIQHIEINTPTHQFTTGLEELISTIKNNKTIVSIGLNINNNNFINQCLNNSIYPYFNPPSINY